MFKTIFVHQIPRMGMDTATIARVAKTAGMSAVMIKVADGAVRSNYDTATRRDYAQELVDALHAVGIQAWGWQYVYGRYPLGEAQMAADCVRVLRLDGFVIDAEKEYKAPGMAANAKLYVNALRRAVGSAYPLGITAYRFPSLHREFPWHEFLSACQYNFPQVYWEQSHNAAAQLARCVREFGAMSPARPIVAMAPTYAVGGWRPLCEDIHAFMESARELGLAGMSFFCWDELRAQVPDLWTEISGAEPASEVVRYVLTYAWRWLRAGPGTAYARVGHLTAGARFEVVQVLGDWGRLTDGTWIYLRNGAVKVTV